MRHSCSMIDALTTYHSERSEESNREQFDEPRFFVALAPQNDRVEK